MKARFRLLTLLGGLVLFPVSCNNIPTQDHGPITLGDSATIVTEKDPQKLQDLVTDLQPEIPPSIEDKDTEGPPAKAVTDDDKKNKAPGTPPAQIAANLPGLSADFEDVSVFIQNVSARLSGNKSLLRASGAVYTYVSGNINGNILKVMGNVTKVSQRYQVAVILKNSMGTLILESLSNTSDWEQLAGGNNLYRITGLDARSLEYPKANAATIRNAVAKAARRRHYSRRKTEEWVNSAHNVRSVSQKPLYCMLRSVMWKIDGKGANGKPFSKQIRIDMPL